MDSIITDMLSNVLDVIDATPEKNPKEREKKLGLRHTNKNTAETLEKCLHLQDKYRIYETAMGSACNNPYVYFDIHEITEFTNQHRVLKYNNIFLMGYYKFDSRFGKILTDSQESDDGSIINLDFKLSSEIMPIENSVISAYGSIEYDPQPILLVNFFRREEGYHKQYQETLKFVRNFIPRCSFDVISIN